MLCFFFFFNDTATTEIYTLSLHDALPISSSAISPSALSRRPSSSGSCPARSRRSEEHTSELQSHVNLVCRLLLEKKYRCLPCSAHHRADLHARGIVLGVHHGEAHHNLDVDVFFNDTATTEIYTLSLHDALPIS